MNSIIFTLFFIISLIFSIETKASDIAEEIRNTKSNLNSQITLHGKSRILLEAADYGFGPISSTLALLDKLVESFKCEVITTGNSLKLVQSTKPNVITHDIDTHRPESWKSVTKIMTDNTLIISNTNLHFANWAIKQGYRVGVSDTLYWFWNAFPDKIYLAEFYAAQWYFLESKNKNQLRPNEDKIKVILTKTNCDFELPDLTKDKSLSTAIIAFGGMSFRSGEDISLKYARWILNITLPIILSNKDIEEVHIIGGEKSLTESIPKNYLQDSRVKVRGILPHKSYEQLLVQAYYQLLTPGLTTLYEANAMGISPLFLPGFSASMILQAYDYNLGSKGVGYTCEWTWAQEVVDKFRPITKDGSFEDDKQLFKNKAVNEEWVASKLRSEVTNFSTENEALNLQNSLHQYLASPIKSSVNSLMLPSKLPNVEDIVYDLFKDELKNH